MKYPALDLPIEQLVAEMAIDPQSLTLMTRRDEILDMVVFKLVRSIATIPGKHHLRVPLTWWDAFKESEADRSPLMRAWVRRHPIRYRVWKPVEFLPAIKLPAQYKAKSVQLFVGGWRSDL